MKTKTRENLRLVLAAALFMALTLVKLLLPAQSADVRARVRAAVSRDYDYREALTALGERLTAGEADPVPASGDADAGDFRLTEPEALRASRLAPLPRGTTGDIAAALASPRTEAQPAAQTEPEAVTAFLASQEPYADRGVPADACYEMPALPFSWESPLPGVTGSGFGYRLHPLLGEVKFHYGTDFPAYTGTDILCFAGGTVAMVGWDEGYGNYIMVDHPGGWRTLYAHCDAVCVTGGDPVTMGQVLGQVGATGQVTGPHLHFELSCDGVRYNPEFYLA